MSVQYHVTAENVYNIENNTASKYFRSQNPSLQEETRPKLYTKRRDRASRRGGWYCRPAAARCTACLRSTPARKRRRVTARKSSSQTASRCRSAQAVRACVHHHAVTPGDQADELFAPLANATADQQVVEAFKEGRV